MQRAVVLSLVLPLTAGCYRGVHLQSLDEMPAESRAIVAKNEAYYLGKAREQAAFSLSCPAEQVTTKPVSTRPCELKGFIPAQRTAYYVEHGTCIATIGAEGCGQRKTYEVLCAPHEEYRSGYWVNDNVSGPPCTVVSSGEATPVITRIHQEQKEQDEAYAAAAAADDARHHAEAAGAHRQEMLQQDEAAHQQQKQWHQHEDARQKAMQQPAPPIGKH
jgi:hypothetical protein